MKISSTKEYGKLLAEIKEQIHSAQNLWYMGQFYLNYKDNAKLQPLVGEISWIKNVLIMSKINLIYMRLFYLKCQKSQTPSHQLSWSHYFELLKIENKLREALGIS